MNLLRVLISSVVLLPALTASDAPVAELSAGAAAPVADNWLQVLDRYIASSQQQQTALHNTTMDVEIDARLPRMKREGSARGVREIAADGQIAYDKVTSTGDKMVNKEVIARFLSAETEASRGIKDSKGNPQSMAINPENYRFRQKAILTRSDRQIFVIQLTPRKNRLGLFKGEIWLDADTALPMREAGRLVKSPSVFLKKIEFVRDYQIVDGISVPVRWENRVETRLVGPAEMEIRYSNHSLPLTAQSTFCPLGW